MLGPRATGGDIGKAGGLMTGLALRPAPVVAIVFLVAGGRAAGQLQAEVFGGARRGMADDAAARLGAASVPSIEGKARLGAVIEALDPPGGLARSSID